jgi:hypothetical protein
VGKTDSGESLTVHITTMLLFKMQSFKNVISFFTAIKCSTDKYTNQAREHSLQDIYMTGMSLGFE